jgi:hypothetical protein
MADQDITERLDTIISLLIPRFKSDSYDFKGVKLDVLGLCDYNHTIEDLMGKLKQSRQIIINSLNQLRKQGFITSINKGEEKVFIRLK